MSLQKPLTAIGTRLAGQTDNARLGVDQLTVRFQGLAAISNVTLAIERHQVVGLIGPNGAGKTTLVNCLTGFQKPTEGRVIFGDYDTADWGPTDFRRHGIARTFQAGRLFNDMTVLENAEVTGVALGLSRDKARTLAMELIGWLGLGDKRHLPASVLAYTDQRRLGIARSLMLRPAFILLDEPAAGMSDAECDELAKIITDIPKEFLCGVLLIEHNMHLVMGICDRIHVLDGGQSVAEGTPAEIQKHEAVLAAYLGMEN